MTRKKLTVEQLDAVVGGAGGQQTKKYSIDKTLCINCGCCANACPVCAIEETSDFYHKINSSDCIGCGDCVSACPMGAIH